VTIKQVLVPIFICLVTSGMCLFVFNDCFSMVLCVIDMDCLLWLDYHGLFGVVMRLSSFSAILGDFFGFF
jgi:hypothetical protein